MSLESLIPPQLADTENVRMPQLAKWLGVYPSTIMKWSREGKFAKCHKLSSKTHLFNVGEVRAALRKLDAPEPVGKKGAKK